MSVHKLPILPDDQHFVYAMFCQDVSGPGYIKFGRSRRIGGRLSQLKSACPVPAKLFAVVDVRGESEAKVLERSLHQHFADRNTQGEWYRFDFSAAEDKRAFNDGCRQVFLHVLTDPGKWWTQISVAALNEYARERQRNLLRNRKLLKKLMHKQFQADRQRRAWKELDAYGRRG